MISLNQTLNGKYRVEKQLGSGGMSTVYLVRDLDLRKLWAMKVIDTSKEEYQSLHRGGEPDELLILKALDHPLCPRLVDRFSLGPCICLVMDYIEGENLQEYLDINGPVPHETAAAWMTDICSLLDYLHSNDIVYRDLKPANMVLCHDGHVKLIDFGFPTKIVRNGDSRDERPFGTPGYAAPEQINGYSDRRSDIYSAGITLYQLLTGISPAKKGFRIKSLRTLGAAIPPGFDQIIKKAARPRADERFGTMTEMIDALKSSSKIEKPYIERLKLKLAISKAMVTAAVCMIISGALLYEACYLRDLSSYNRLIQKDAVEPCAEESDLLEAIGLMPAKDEAYRLLIRKYCENGLDENEFAALEALYQVYEDAVIIKKDGYCGLNYDLAMAYAAFARDIPAGKWGKRLERVLPYLLRGSGSGEFQIQSRALYNLGNALALTELTEKQASAAFGSARSLVLAQEQLIGKDTAAIIIAQSGAALELIAVHGGSLEKAGVSPASAADLLSRIEESLKRAEGCPGLPPALDILEKARLRFPSADKAKESP